MSTATAASVPSPACLIASFSFGPISAALCARSGDPAQQWKRINGASQTDEKAPPEHSSSELPQQAAGTLGKLPIQQSIRLASGSCPLSSPMQAKVSQSQIHNIFGVTCLQEGTCTCITHAPVVAEDVSSSESASSLSTLSSSSSTSAASLAASVASTSSTVSEAVMEALTSLLSGPFLFPDRSPAS